MTNELYIALSFGTHFCNYKDKNIVIYGKGPKTKLVLDVYPDYHIVGIMDGNLKEGMIYNKPVLDIDMLSELSVDIIIVVAQIGTTELIFNRLKEYCYYSNIQLYSISGKNLFEYFGTGKIMGAFRNYCNGIDAENDLRKAIILHNCLIVDILDVLLMRKAVFAGDRFRIIQEKARQRGIDLAEYAILRSDIERKMPYLDIYSIYLEIQKQLNIGDEIKEEFLKIELDLERSWLIPRSKMIDIMREAQNSHKKLFLINNTNLPSDLLENILRKYGIDQYETVLEQENVGNELKIIRKQNAKQKFMYIGTKNSDALADIEIFRTWSALELFRQSSYAYLETYLLNENERSMMGLCIAKVFNDPYVLQSDGRPCMTEAGDIGYAFLGGILTHFIIWLGEQSKLTHYDGILFAARDGFLLQKMYKMLAEYLNEKFPSDFYFYASRRLCASATMENESDIKWLAGIDYKYTPDQMLHDKFGLNAEDILPYDPDKLGNGTTYSLLHKDKIYNSSKKIRSNYLKYIENIGIKKEGHYLFVDFLSVGTCQYFLERIVPFKMDSVYLCRHYNDCNMVSVVKSRSLLENQAPYVAESYFYGHIFFPETILTSPEASVASINENGQPIFAKEERTKVQLEYVTVMQKAILDYFTDYVENFYIKGQPINPYVSDRIYNLMADGYTELKCDILKNLYLIDGMGFTKVSPSY